MRFLLLTLAAIGRAYETPSEARPPGYPKGARFGLVGMVMLDHDWRHDDPWLNWATQWFGHLREQPSRSGDETHIA